jgi:hypothetical protein
MSLARIAHVRLAADGLYWCEDMLAEAPQPAYPAPLLALTGLRQSRLPAGRYPANVPSEAVMRIGSVIIIVWLIIGAIAAGQRHYYSSSDPNCARAGTIIVTVLAGPLNYTGVNPKISCKTPQPSK